MPHNSVFFFLENNVLRRAHSASSNRSFDSSYGSRRSSYVESLASGYLGILLLFIIRYKRSLK